MVLLNVNVLGDGKVFTVKSVSKHNIVNSLFIFEKYSAYFCNWGRLPGLNRVQKPNNRFDLNWPCNTTFYLR